MTSHETASTEAKLEPLSRLTRLVPRSIRRALTSSFTASTAWNTNRSLVQLRTKSLSLTPGSTVRYGQVTITVNDGLNFYMMVKDIFIHRIYHFTAHRPDPLILDCGSNIGIAVLYFKQVYPKARILAFEPDASIVSYLHQNVAANRLTGVEVIQAGLGACTGDRILYSDGRYGSSLVAPPSVGVHTGQWSAQRVSGVRLRDYLSDTVDFLKMNIEGAEWEVLADSEDRLSQVREMVVEYHHLPGLPRTLPQILGLLDRQGFEYLINAFDGETNPAVRPPFRLDETTQYFLLIYASRREGRRSPGPSP